ncbi:hypothetical protein POM88_039909 [Heracleum sosnowskyi]|uniref:Uncharacterized protein n=1 Tax=Heracleum sosnowskyi TaxID=360622 RepID=A0AAD8HDQ5_9APIA|nr:hypothetical protein POM88_039909 [Heracleum sosnowskyi]
MIMNAIQFLHVLVVTFLLCMKTTSSGSESLSKDYNTTRCIERERKALLVFKQGLSSARRHDLLELWKDEEEDCCKWKGVICDNHTGHVTRLHLSSLISLCYMNSTSVSISYSLLDLPYLKYLDLSKNCLDGFPGFIGSLKKLVHLDLSDNRIGESIPYHIVNLSYMQYLNLSNNYLNGSIPKFIGSLSSLRYLGNLADVLFGRYPLLQELLVSENHFSGSLPDITLLSSLRKLEVSSNQLSGYLPPVFEHQSALNDFSGSLPNFIGLSSLRLLHLYKNNFSGSLPDFTGCSSFQVLRLDENRLTKWETQSIGLLSSLKELDLSMNTIHNTINEEHLSNLSCLEYIRASFNPPTLKFSSEWLPPFKLRELSLASYNWMHYQGLVLLNLGYNNFFGRIPRSIGYLVSLQTLILRNNKLYGDLPVSIRNCSSLGFVDLGLNKLSGKVPLWIGEYLQQLYALILKSNSKIEVDGEDNEYKRWLYTKALSLDSESDENIPPVTTSACQVMPSHLLLEGS